MSYTREQRAANAAKAADAAMKAAVAAGLNTGGGATEPSPEPASEPQSEPRRQQRSGARSEPEATEKPEREIIRGNKTRAAAMEEIVNRNAPPATETPEPKAEPAATAPAPAPATPKGEDAPEPLPMPEPIKMAKVKVDGEEFEVPQTDVDDAGSISAYQRLRAADNRLRKANEVLAEARRFQQQPQAPVAPPKPTVSDDEYILSKADSIRFGTPQEFVSGIRDIVNQLHPKTDDNVLITKTTANINHDIAKAKFVRDYQDVVANPTLVDLVPLHAQRGLSQYMKNGQPDWSKLATLDWDKFYAKIGNTIRSAVPRSSQPHQAAVAPGTPTPATPDKEARKASIVNLPTAAGARAALPEEEKPPTREEILADMKKARKQTV